VYIFKCGAKAVIHTRRNAICRPLGGGVDFGETHNRAIQREIMEELGLAITDLSLISVLENFFTFNQAGYKIIFVYDAKFIDSSVYLKDNFQGQESNGEFFNARWLALGSINANTPLIYPAELIQLLKQQCEN
jgi:8-oxo-dGTP pyrophosphatase MutT (NUDIX family)